ncbi:C40 family peptidase [Streptomyces fildesensis]|uniref:C40 family peptidase n=1 Tax=Streptomyces fildesensis TaxID=375757 RepID=UPI0018DFCE18|nr:NlpC/P60 family protein [Streptomyces fildesensis]
MSGTTGQVAAVGAVAAAAAVAGLFVFSLAIVGATSQEDDDKNPDIGNGIGDALNIHSVKAEYVPWVIAAGKLCPAVKAPVIAAQIEAESNWDPRAVSGVGAEGMSQFMPGTWATYGVDADKDGKADPFTPADAIMTQGRYDCQLAKEISGYKGVTGDPTELMLAGYNAGPGAVQQAHGIPPFPETQQYVKRIMSLVPKYSDLTAIDVSTPFGQRVVAAGKKWLGTPYSWGGGTVDGPSRGFAQGSGTVGFDCSSLVQYAIFHASGGKTMLPRTSQAQAAVGTAVKTGDLRPGDVIAFALHGGTDYDHIGIYIGDRKFLHAPKTGDVVKISSLDDPYYTGVPQTVRRFG